MLDIAQGKGIVGELIRHGEVRANRLEWTNDSGETFTNPSTPVVTLYDGEREVTAVCITWRRLERTDEPQARRKVAADDMDVLSDFIGAAAHADASGVGRGPSAR